MDANITTKSRYGQPAFVGGLVMGVLSALPFISALNACCCLWVVSGGLVAAYLLQQNQSLPITAGDGALVGLLAGVIGAVVTVALAIPIDLLFQPVQRQIAGRLLESGDAVPPALRQFLENYSEPRNNLGIAGVIVVRMIFLCLLLFVGSIFSTLGGLLGVALFRKRVPPGVIDIPASQ